MKKSLTEESVGDISAKLRQANNDFAKIYPGETGKRQPVHTVYGGAHLFKSDSAERLGALARRSLDQFAPDFLSFAKAIELGGADGLPDSLEEDSGLLNRLETNGEQVRLENKPAWFAMRSTTVLAKNCAANRSKIFASILKTVTAIVPMMRKMDMRPQPRWKWPPEWKTTRCRRSLASASNHSQKSCACAACARSTFLFRL